MAGVNAVKGKGAWGVSNLAKDYPEHTPFTSPICPTVTLWARNYLIFDVVPNILLRSNVSQNAR